MTENTRSLIINFDDFDGPNKHRFLSNFYIGSPINLWGYEFTTGEHAFQAMKAGYPHQRKGIANARTPGESKSLGRSCVLRPDWEHVKYDVMAAVLRAKFTIEREEGKGLLGTGNALLVEGTAWGDRVWGTAGRRVAESLQPPTVVKSPGRNWLGTLLMARRAELRAEELYGVIHNTGQYNEHFGA